jgi:hypothetical protein
LPVRRNLQPFFASQSLHPLVICPSQHGASIVQPSYSQPVANRRLILNFFRRRSSLFSELTRYPASLRVFPTTLQARRSLDSRARWRRATVFFFRVRPSVFLPSSPRTLGNSATGRPLTASTVHSLIRGLVLSNGAKVFPAVYFLPAVVRCRAYAQGHAHMIHTFPADQGRG